MAAAVGGGGPVHRKRLSAGTDTSRPHFCLVVGAMAGLPRWSAGGWELGWAVGLTEGAAAAADKCATDA